MKRFYKQVAAEAADGGFAIRLDDRPVRTPKRAPLALPTSALAHAVAAEWDAQGDDVDPRSMPLTGLSNAAIDHVMPDPAGFIATIAAYAETDLLCYRAEHPDSLVALQARSWDPILNWARQRYAVDFTVTSGILHKPQPFETVSRLATAIGERSPFQLAGFQPLVTISGSLVIALALADGWIDARAAFDAAHLDEIWQAENWGEDDWATRMRDDHRRDFEVAARFLALLV